MSADELSDLAHDVVSKASSLKEAAALLKRSSAAERAELLSLMVRSARELAERLETFEKEQKPA